MVRCLGILQTADKAMDEQLKILDTIKTKATQFNGKQLLSGNFINQEFQIGASSNQT